MPRWLSAFTHCFKQKTFMCVYAKQREKGKSKNNYGKEVGKTRQKKTWKKMNRQRE